MLSFEQHVTFMEDQRPRIKKKMYLLNLTSFLQNENSWKPGLGILYIILKMNNLLKIIVNCKSEKIPTIYITTEYLKNFL